MAKQKIIQIDKTKYDGLGACLGQCSQRAIAIVEREASEDDPAALCRGTSAAMFLEKGGPVG